MESDDALAICLATTQAVGAALRALDNWGEAGTRPGQYLSDLAADARAVEVLVNAGCGVLSEESGIHDFDREVLAVLDPLDGSTNASRGIPWYATSVCLVDSSGPFVAMVVNQASGRTYHAVRGKGAFCDGVAIVSSAQRDLGASIIGLSGHTDRHLGWRQYRALGAAALDLCAVADGTLDGFCDCDPDAHGVWDYLGGMLICQEAGVAIADAEGRELNVLEHAARRTPVAAATPELLAALVAARNNAKSL